MAANKQEPAGDTAVRLAKMSEPLSEPMAECLRALAGMAFASANQVTGVGQWSEVCLSLQIRDDGSAETAVFYAERPDDETDSLDLPAEEGSSALRELGRLVAGGCGADRHPAGRLVRHQGASPEATRRPGRQASRRRTRRHLDMG